MRSQPYTGAKLCALDEFVSPFECYPEGYQILAEDDDWFIGKMTMKAGAQDPPHSHLDHLVRSARRFPMRCPSLGRNATLPRLQSDRT
jgi:hypothetical protein